MGEPKNNIDWSHMVNCKLKRIKILEKEVELLEKSNKFYDDLWSTDHFCISLPPRFYNYGAMARETKEKLKKIRNTK